MKTNMIYTLALLLTAGLHSTSCSKNTDKREAAKEYLRNQTTQYVVQEEAPTAEASSEAHDEIYILTDKNFDKTISQGLTLVDFWAEWCRPCRMQAPIVEQIAVEMKDKVKVGKIDIDHNRKTPQVYQVMNIPTMILYKDGQVVERIVGLTDKNTLMNYINKHI
jgi:thioredoxin 1